MIISSHVGAADIQAEIGKHGHVKWSTSSLVLVMLWALVTSGGKYRGRKGDEGIIKGERVDEGGGMSYTCN